MSTLKVNTITEADGTTFNFPYTLLNTTTVSGSSTTITFSSSLITDDFQIYKVQFHGLKGANNLRIQVSADNGSNYRTSGYVGARNRYYTADQGSNFVEDTDYHSDALYFSSVGNTDRMTQEVTIVNIRDSGIKTASIAHGGFGDQSTYQTFGIWGARYNTAEAHNNMRIIAQGDSFTSGSVSLYGLKT
tara:strand:- start:181 stop:747 length:567 start_codon:yes stop_codon:yes gene_type:complete